MELPVAILRQTAVSVVGATWRGHGVNPESPYDGFSLCHYTGDNDTHARKCRKKLATRFGITPENVLVPGQVHGTMAAVITSPRFNPTDLENVDSV